MRAVANKLEQLEGMTKREKIEHLASEGYEAKEIAKLAGSSVRYVYNVLNKSKGQVNTSKVKSVNKVNSSQSEQNEFSEISEKVHELNKVNSSLNTRIEQLEGALEHEKNIGLEALSELQKEREVNSSLNIKITSLIEQKNHFTEQIEVLQSELNEAFKNVHSLKEVNTSLNNEKISLSEQIEQLSEQFTELQKRSLKIEKWDIGAFLTQHPNVKFIAVLALVAGQSWVFASLWKDLFTSLHSSIPFFFAFAVAFIFEIGGVMKAAQKLESSSRVDLEEMKSARNWWLGGFLLFQIGIELSFFQLLEWISPGFSVGLGKFLIAGAIPFGILLYSSMYLKTSKI